MCLGALSESVITRQACRYLPQYKGGLQRDKTHSGSRQVPLYKQPQHKDWDGIFLVDKKGKPQPPGVYTVRVVEPGLGRVEVPGRPSRIARARKVNN